MTQVSTTDVPSLADTSRVPRFTGERIEALDALRGFAVFGILLANVQVFSGFFLMPDAQRALLTGAAADAVTVPLLSMLVEGKFYSIFSLLFGIGFAIQLGRMQGGDHAFTSRFRRRLTVLLGIGAAHGFLVWFGDILMLYALAGFALLAFRRSDERTLLRRAVLFAAIPIIQYALMMTAALLATGGAGGGGEGGPPAAPPFGSANYVEALTLNLTGLGFRWADLLFSGRFFKVLAMFLVGLWAVRQSVHVDTPDSRQLLTRVARWGFAVGLPLNLAMALLSEDAYYTLQPAGLLYATVYSIGVPTLALGYAAGFVLLWRRANERGAQRLFVPLGRMALTNYLVHSVVAVLFFYGFGLGFFGSVGATAGIALAVLLVLAQIPASSLWLRTFRHGPAEWLWRRLTLGTPLPFRRSTVRAVAP